MDFFFVQNIAPVTDRYLPGAYPSSPSSVRSTTHGAPTNQSAASTGTWYTARSSQSWSSSVSDRGSGSLAPRTHIKVSLLPREACDITTKSSSVPQSMPSEDVCTVALELSERFLAHKDVEGNFDLLRWALRNVTPRALLCLNGQQSLWNALI